MWHSFDFQLIRSFLIFCLFPQCLAKLTMMLVRGQPSNVSQCNTTLGSIFTDCYQTCYNQRNCVLAFQYEFICYLCDFGTVDSVAQKTYEDDMKVAIKINETSTTCPVTYPVEGQVDSCYLPPIDNRTASYQISFSDGNWEFVYITCPYDWLPFKRTKGFWCMKLYYNASYVLNWQGAIKQCSKYFASTLSGIENSDEYDYIYSSATSIWDTDAGLIILGALRNGDCYPPAAWNSTFCNNTLETFYWTDPFTTGTYGFNYWIHGKPDGLQKNVNNTSIIQLALAMWMCNDTSCNRGLLDDIYCYDAELKTADNGYGCAYVCGVQAQ